MHMKIPAQTGSACIRFIDLEVISVHVRVILIV